MPEPVEQGELIDNRTVREISAEVWNAVWFLLDDVREMDTETAGRIAQTAADLTEIALTRKFQRDITR